MAEELGIKVFGDSRDAQDAFRDLARSSGRDLEAVENDLDRVAHAAIDAGMSADRGLSMLQSELQEAADRAKTARRAFEDAVDSIGGDVDLGRRVFGELADQADRAEREFEQLQNQARRSLGVVSTSADTAATATGKLNAAIVGLTAGLGAMAGNAALGAVQAGMQAVRNELSIVVNAASDLNESIEKTNQVFKENADQIHTWAENAATAFGLSRAAAFENAATLGNLFTAMEVDSQSAVTMSTRLVELASDLASFNNLAGGTEEALVALRAGLVGEVEPLRRMGVQLSAAAVEAKALELGLAATAGALTEADKVFARYQIILDQTRTAQGDFARQSSELANQQRILDATLDDLRATIGQGLIPVLTGATRSLNEFLSSEGFRQWAEDVARKLEEAGKRLTAFVSDHKDDLIELAGTLGETAESAGRLAESLGTAAQRMSDYIAAAQSGGEDQSFLADQIEKTNKDLDDFNNMLVVGEKILRNEWPSKEEFQQLLGLPWWQPASEQAAEFAGVLGTVRESYDDISSTIREFELLVTRLFPNITGQAQEYTTELDRLRAMAGQVTKQEDSHVRVTREWIRAGLEAANTADRLVGTYDAAAVEARRFQRYVDDLAAAHDRLRGALNPVEAALDVFAEQIRAGIPLTEEQRNQVLLLGAAQAGLQQRINEVTIAQGLAAIGFNTNLSPAVSQATGLMLGGVQAGAALHGMLYSLTAQTWVIPVEIQMRVAAPGRPGFTEFGPGEAPPAAPEMPPPFDIDAWIADILGDVGGASASASTGGGGGGGAGGGSAASSAAQEAGISLANQIVEALVQSVLDGERSVEDAVAFVLENLSNLGITEEDLFASLAASWRELQEAIVTGTLAGEDVSQAQAALAVLQDAIEAATGQSIEDFAAWVAAIEEAETKTSAGTARMEQAFDNATAAAEALVSSDPFGWLTRTQAQLAQLQAQIDLAPVLGIPQEIVDEWIAQRDALAEQIELFGTGLGEALASGLIDAETLASLDEATRKLVLQILAPFVDPAVLEQIAAAGVEVVEKVSAESLERLKALFAEAPDVAADMIDEIVAAVQSGALSFEQAMQLLADVPDEILRPALERMRAQLQAQLATALLSLGPDSPEVQAILESLALIEAALEGVGEESEKASRSLTRSFKAAAVGARDEALTQSPIMRQAMAAMSGGGFGSGGGAATFGAGGTAGWIDPADAGGTFVAQIEIDRHNHERFVVDVANRRMSRILG